MDTQLPQSRAGGQGPYLRLPGIWAGAAGSKKKIHKKKVKCDQQNGRQSGM